METHSIFKLLKSFTKKDIKNFTRFISSPYYNTNEQVVNLFKDIIRFYPKFTSKKLFKTNIYERLYKKEKYNDSTMRNLFFRLEKQIEKYFIIENVTRNKLNIYNSLLSELNLKYLKDHFVKTSDAYNHYFATSSSIDFSYYYNKYLYEVNKFNFYSLHEKSTRKNNIKLQLASLEKNSIYLTIFFITEIICNYLNASTYYYNFKLSENDGLLKSLVDSLEIGRIHELLKEEDQDSFILKIYLALYNCYSNLNDDRYYYEYRELIKKYSRKFSQDEISFHHSKLINYCIWKQSRGEKKEEYKQELLNIYKVFLEKGYYKNSKIQHLPDNLYRAILFLALRLKEFTWSKNIIESFTNKVDPLHRQNMYNFGNAFYFFHTGQFEKSIEYVNNVKNDYFIFKYDINNLLLRLNYTVFNPDETARVLHKYKEALREDELLPDELKTSHLNFINFYNKLVAATENNKQVEIGFLINKLEKCKNVIQKDWLMDKFEILIERERRKIS